MDNANLPEAIMRYVERDTEEPQEVDIESNSLEEYLNSLQEDS